VISQVLGNYENDHEQQIFFGCKVHVNRCRAQFGPFCDFTRARGMKPFAPKALNTRYQQSADRLTFHVVIKQFR
jgi:hypothetical protein